MTKWRIILLQSFRPILSSIELFLDSVNEERAREVFYTTSIKDAVEEAGRHENVIVVSGNVFECENLSGMNIAAMVKAANPKALFFIYSFVPEIDKNKAHVDGFISKGGSNGYQNLVDIFAGISDETTLESLAKDFGCVHLSSEF